jgi:hypothetical protein
MPFSELEPLPFTSVAIEAHAPVASGVYGILNAQGWVYVGEAEDIRAALLTHLQDLGESVMARAPTGFVFEVCDGAARPARQDRLVFEYEPPCNRQSSQQQRQLWKERIDAFDSDRLHSSTGLPRVRF